MYIQNRCRTNLGRQFKRHIPCYLFLILPLAQVIIFNYFPMYGIQIAFKKFVIARGITGSPWVGLKHFTKLFNDPAFYSVLRNTLRLSFLGLVINFPFAIIFALLLNEIGNAKFKRISQTITYMPHFLSWVVVGNFVFQLLSPSNGVVNAILLKLGVIDKPIYFVIQESVFTPMYIISTLWKEVGWGSIIYLATIAGIDPSLYEAAVIDGAGRFQKVLHVTIPAILPTVSTLFILQIGSIMNVGFDPIFNLYTEGTYSVADVISTFVYRRGLVEAKYDYTTAIGLFQNLIGFALVLFGNFIAKKADPDFRIM